jgi:hypothetical protein
MKTKIITAIYSDLHGTELGGRPSRGGHYKYSLRSLLKMSDADFVCYTSSNEIDDLENFFYVQNNINESQLTFKIFDLRNFEFTEKINKIKNIDEVKVSDRCVEIQYSKFIWSLDELHIGDYDVVYWFDAGLSHCGLIPNNYLTQTGYWEQNYESPLFNNTFLKNLTEFTSDKIVLCSKENQQNYWSGTLPEKYYEKHCMDRHIIGGFFGGKKDKMKEYCELFLKTLEMLLENENMLYHEEHIMSLLYYNYNNLYNPLEFDTWWHEDANIPGLDMVEYLSTRKSFYKILEELNEIVIY